ELNESCGGRPGVKAVTIREFWEQAGLQADPERPVLSNVKVLGFVSRNRREYTAGACREALPLYEGVAVHVDHPRGSPDEPRPPGAASGKPPNARLAKDGIRADLPYNPKHPLAESVRWFAENMPEALGLSQNAKGRGYTDAATGVYVVEEIVSVRSVDLVADP